MLRIFIILIGSLLQGQTEPNLKIRSDLAAKIEIDGKESVLLQAGEARQFTLSAGEHEIVARAHEGGQAWKRLVIVSSALATSVEIPLRLHQALAEVEKKGYWKDERSKLIWAAADNGSGLTVSQAHYYCRTLKTGGFGDWRLPEIDELQPLFGGPLNERGFRVAVPLKLSGWAWSATQGNEEAENWTLDFGDGARASVAAGDAGLNRALCVRKSN